MRRLSLLASAALLYAAPAQANGWGLFGGGTPGPQGPAGTSPTVSVGTVSGLATGTKPTVTDSGSGTAHVFNFGLPAGPIGATGNQGATGPAGANGSSPTYAAPAVSGLAAGAQPTVQDTVNGLSHQLTFGIPAGPVGATGPAGPQGPAGTGGGTATNVGNGTDLSPGNITPTGGTATSAAVIGAAAVNAVPQVATINGPETGFLDFEGTGQLVHHGQNSWQWNNKPWINAGGGTVSGFGSYSAPFANYGYGDVIKEAAESDAFGVSDSMGNGARGARNAIISNMQINGQLGDAGPIIGLVTHSYATGTMPVLAADGWPVGLYTVGGGMQGLWDNMSSNPPTGRAATGIGGMINTEIDSGFPSNEMVSVHYGVDVVDQGTTAATQFGGVTWHGLNDDIGYTIQGPSWQTLYGAGSRVNGWAGNPEQTLFKVFQREYGGPPTAPFQARDGFDTRGMNFLGSAWASAGVAINSAGAVSAKMLETGAGLQAYTATVASGTVVVGGEYYSFPGYSVDAPPLGGTTATVATSTMSLLNIGKFGSTGTGYAVGDVLTAGTGLVIPLSGGTATADVGLTGTPFQFTVSSVNSFGGITGGSFTNNGSITDVPNDHLITLTGGKGSGAVIFVYYGETTSFTNTGQPVLSAFRLIPNGWTYGASGAGFKPGDTVTPSGDTGTQGVIKIGSVTSTGAVLMQAMSLVSGGSVTALSGASPHPIATSGAGTNLDALFGYTVTGVTTTPGSGYLADQQLLVTPNQSDFVNAKVRLTMTAAPATLPLNPKGGDVSVANGNLIVGTGKVYLDTNKTEWVQEINGKVTIGTGATNLFSIDGNGNVVAKGTITQSGTP